ncbi:MAG: BolA/IbaG family iron-sulfur metabolism protein [Betaproteobacteria bacterium]|nr:BolA/IbaG family iron-sulfur metabolism protein [Betaproteobacteria bacterium]
MQLIETIQTSIQQGLPCDWVRVSGDGQHFEAVVVSSSFVGKSRVACHQLVFNTLGERMREEVHALSIKTYTPAQWTEMQG